MFKALLLVDNAPVLGLLFLTLSYIWIVDAENVG
jgi:hypothetical protein